MLQECRMSKYYSYFRDAGIDTVELYARKTDREVGRAVCELRSPPLKACERAINTHIKSL